MAKSIALPMLCLVLLVALPSPSYSQVGLQFCPTELTIPGTCGNNGGFECFEAINAKFGASAMAMKCTCQALQSNERLCKCLIVCRE
ncbi:hypothetical protein QUC31_019051 [Theobroma cacao]|uniref:SCR-like 9, putative n=1 Tax=Theobroma cacao TaxID=3641 RepID=A0A061GUU5_THECC|nr:SCR-like 9, putative [Theobroma cacao]WRX31647.1 Plant self-incompatibility response - like 1 [Theobroma cacao]WRX31795.1 Plant self-incompatibility response - like 2 [Theobroma cacao]